MFNFKALNCNHDYQFLDKNKPNMPYPSLEKAENYIFKCDKCGYVKVIDNYEVIQKIQEIFTKFLNEELKKPQEERLSNEDFMNKIWNRYSEYSIINKSLRKHINMTPIVVNRELSRITESDILSLKFTVNGPKVYFNLGGREIQDNWPYLIAKNKKGDYVAINNIRFGIEVQEEKNRLKGDYLRKGIKKEEDELTYEAFSNISETYKILYKQTNK